MRSTIKNISSYNILRLLLIPVSLLFIIIIYLRNFCYRAGIFKSIKLNIPIISIGNITTGGTGKTPLLIYLAEYFLKKGIPVGIVSRGYLRKSKNSQLICNGSEIFTNQEDSGDEVFMVASFLKSKYSDFSIAVSNDRIEGINLLINNGNPEIIILDDAFQNLKTYRNLDIVLIDIKNNKLFRNKLLLPAGNLRETSNSLKRCDVIILNYKFFDDTNFEKDKLSFEKLKKPVIAMKYKINPDYENNLNLFKLSGGQAILFCGIAEPDSFINFVINSGINIKKFFIYPDHYAYKNSDFMKMEKYLNNNDFFLTTEKDYVKVIQFKEFCNNNKIYSIKIDVDITGNKDTFEKKLNFDVID